jgi:hypothetical protein
MAKTIELTRGRVAIVDDEDYEALAKYRWTALRGNRTWYARRTEHCVRYWMHRQIMCTPAGAFTDHINGDGLDNRRTNLRVVSQFQNARNRTHKALGKSSRFRGVCWDKQRCLWRATIRVNGRIKTTGWSVCEFAAAGAYDAAGIARDPEHFTPNFSASWLAPVQQ